jgi:nucleoside-diphosphate-sugar epimerase
MPPQRVLITGGAGFLAANLADCFRRNGISVRLLDIADRPDWAHEPELKFFRGDLRDPAVVMPALEGANAVVHAAFASPWQSAEAMRSVNIEGTRKLCGGAVAQGVRRFILISSTIVSKPRITHPFFHNSPLTRLDLYRESRAEAENIVAAHGSKGMSTAIVRPKTFVGPGRVGAFAILFACIRLGQPVPVLGSGNNRYQLLDIRDMAEGIRLLQAANTDGVFYFGARDFRTVHEDLKALIAHACTGARLQFIPGRTARAVLRAVELANIVPLSEWHYMSAHGQDSVVDISRAERELGWRPDRSNAQALREAYDWYFASAPASGTITAHPVPFVHQVLQRLSSMFPG